MLGNMKLVVVMLVGLVLWSGCKEDAARVVVSMDTSNLTALRIDVLEGYPLVPDLNVQLRAVAEFNESAEQDWTNRVVWTVSDEEIATVTPNGILRFLREGSVIVQIVASDGWFEEKRIATDEILGLRVELAHDVIFIDESTPLTVVAELGSESEMALAPELDFGWILTNSVVADWHQVGVLRGMHTGSTIVLASLAGLTSAPAVLIVDSLIGIQCAELSQAPYIPLDTLNFSATAQTQIVGSLPLTDKAVWLSDSPGIVASENGRYYAIANGTFQVSSRFMGVTSNQVAVEILNVISLELDTLVLPGVLGRRDSAVFEATAIIEGHDPQDFTDKAIWICSDLNSARFKSPGVVLARRTGTPEIYAKVATVQSSHVQLMVVIPELYADGFESYPLGDFEQNEYWEVWTGQSPGATQVVITDETPALGRSCVFIDSMYSETAGINTKEFHEPLLNGVVEMSVWPGPGCWVWVGGSSSTYAAAIIVFTYNEIEANLNVVGTYQDDEWIRVHVEFDCATDRYDLYINDEQIQDNAYFYNPQTDLRNFSCYNSPADEFGLTYVDDFWLDGEEDSSPAVSNNAVRFAGVGHSDLPIFYANSRESALAYRRVCQVK